MYKIKWKKLRRYVSKMKDRPVLFYTTSKCIIARKSRDFSQLHKKRHIYKTFI